jgi:hypothetical protein
MASLWTIREKMRYPAGTPSPAVMVSAVYGRVSSTGRKIGPAQKSAAAGRSSQKRESDNEAGNGFTGTPIYITRR